VTTIRAIAAVDETVRGLRHHELVSLRCPRYAGNASKCFRDAVRVLQENADGPLVVCRTQLVGYVGRKQSVALLLPSSRRSSW